MLYFVSCWNNIWLLRRKRLPNVRNLHTGPSYLRTSRSYCPGYLVSLSYMCVKTLSQPWRQVNLLQLVLLGFHSQLRYARCAVSSINVCWQFWHGSSHLPLGKPEQQTANTLASRSQGRSQSCLECRHRTVGYLQESGQRLQFCSSGRVLRLQTELVFEKSFIGCWVSIGQHAKSSWSATVTMKTRQTVYPTTLRCGAFA